MEKTYIAWNLPNWITIVLMASLGMVIIGLITAGVKTITGAPNSSAAA